MLNKRYWLYVAAAIFSLSFSQVWASETQVSTDTPEDAINHYITAVKTGSGLHFRIAFKDTAAIQYFDREDQYKQFTRDAFAEYVNTGNQWGAQIEITELKTTGKVANATVEFTWGEQGQFGYVDYLNLIDDGSGWKISDKVAQFIRRSK